MYPLERRPLSPPPRAAAPAPASDAELAPPTLALLASALHISSVRYRGTDAWVAPRLTASQLAWVMHGIAVAAGAALAGKVAAALPRLLSLLASPFALLFSQAEASPARAARPVLDVVDVAQNAFVRGAKALILAAACAFFAFGVFAVLRPRNFLRRRKGKGKAAPLEGLYAVWPLNLLVR